MVTEKEKSAAVKLVPAGAGDDVDGPARRDARGQIEICRADLEFLHDLLGEVLLRAPIDCVIDARPIYGDAREIGIVAENGDILGAIVIALVIRRDDHARRQERQLQKAAPVQRKLLDLLPAHYLVDGVTLVFHLGSRGIHGYRLFLVTHLKMEIDSSHGTGRYHRL